MAKKREEYGFMISHQGALIYTMVLVSAADQEMTDEEMNIIGDVVKHLPVFRDYDPGLLPSTAEACAELLDQEDGLDKAVDLISVALPEELRDTAYAIACDVAAADGEVSQEEMRLLEILRHRLEIDRLTAAAIERGAQARFRRI